MGILVLIMGLIAGLAPIAILIVIVAAIVKKSKESKNSFEDTVRNVYIYIILIVTFVSIIAGTIATFSLGLDVLLPEKETYQTSYSREQQDRNEAIIELCTTFSLVLASIPVYIYHNKLAKKAKENKEVEINNNNY